ncbi:MAG TPA: hypothetical protein QGH10_19170 [Armatimonadota bacterium]|nr:hypothetical protein [Armatimonadota bacterium]
MKLGLLDLRQWARRHSADIGALLLLLAVLSMLAVYQWRQPVVRLHTDPARWMDETRRATDGQVPYRDFTWMYPPLGIIVSAAWAEVSGLSLESFHLFVTVMGIAIGFLLWGNLRVLGFGPWTAVLSSLLCVCSSFLSVHSRLLSLNIYTPSALIATFGGALSLLGLHTFVQGRRLWSLGVGGVGLGICLASKPEAALAAALAGTVAIAALRRPPTGVAPSPHRGPGPLRWALVLCVSAFGTAAIAYLPLVVKAGPSNVLEGIRGYGVLASELTQLPPIADALNATVCYGGLAAGGLAAACMVWMALYLVARRDPPHFRNSIILLSAGIAIAFIVALARYVVHQLRPHDSFAEACVWAGVWLAPVLTGALLLARRDSSSDSLSRYWVCAAVAVAYALVANGRAMVWPCHFSAHLPMGMFLWLIAVRYGGLRLQSLGVSDRARCLGTVVIVSGLACVVIKASFIDARVAGQWVQTPRGRVAVPTDVADVLSDTLVSVHSMPPDESPLLSGPYGSGMNYLSHRSSPVGQTQFVRLRLGGRTTQRMLSNLAMGKQYWTVTADEGGLLSTEASRATSPVLWEYIDSELTPVRTISAEGTSLRFTIRAPRSRHPSPLSSGTTATTSLGRARKGA